MKTIALRLSQLLPHRQKRRSSSALGERELEVMKILWQDGALSAKEVLTRLSDTTLSLSTMQSTLERLHRKSLLSREKVGRFYIYQAAVSRNEMIRELLGNIAEQVSDGQMAPMISGFMDFIEQDTSGTVSAEMKEVMERLVSDDGR
ncbi:BlaI/MecI/CopY family transcriptional regulator [Marinibactrum halimedae]|uniref:Transcriptional regulator n=1 Tax=Marinibactrum halimedae TaxID=1444977 RepID=A0AA37T0U4_9GAMM|nr:BlaI/MecI/CopY family transcriptional regulator [Marinibactrum halimedae]MCD9457831.1 BlaI/MecI/CopY family transcriptional regulator [Marinibactrum halimedae]GLS24795.1 transcriptional regulator [Marinibactrum halimedae]